MRRRPASSTLARRVVAALAAEDEARWPAAAPHRGGGRPPRPAEACPTDACPRCLKRSCLGPSGAGASNLDPSGFGRPSTRVSTWTRSPVPLSNTRKWLTRSTGRSCSTTVSVRPRAASIHPASSSAFDTVADRQTNFTALRRVDDDLLPHRPAVGVLQVVDLVEHHPGQVVERRRVGVDHVPQDLGGHHHHPGVAG